MAAVVFSGLARGEEDKPAGVAASAIDFAICVANTETRQRDKRKCNGNFILESLTSVLGALLMNCSADETTGVAVRKIGSTLSSVITRRRSRCGDNCRLEGDEWRLEGDVSGDAAVACVDPASEEGVAVVVVELRERNDVNGSDESLMLVD